MCTCMCAYMCQQQFNVIEEALSLVESVILLTTSKGITILVYPLKVKVQGILVLCRGRNDSRHLVYILFYEVMLVLSLYYKS